MQQYSPFDKRIADLQPNDRAVLKSVSEGWYVDYKSRLIDARAMAKALSAIPNTYGGWLFIGVGEHSKDERRSCMSLRAWQIERWMSRYSAYASRQPFTSNRLLFSERRSYGDHVQRSV